MAITAAELVVKVGADVSDAESGLKSFSGKMKNIGGQMASVGGVLSATIAAPLIGIAVASVKTAADFEKSMNVLGYASGATADQMQALSDQALQLGADTVFSANEAAEGMVDLAKAGMSTADIMGAIPGVMDLAAAGQIGVSEAANLTAAALSTFNLEATEAGHVADVLAAAANASTADVADLAFGLQNAGSVFSSNGQSLESLATMMALLANNGINASDAATSLKTMTMKLTAPTAAAAKVMKKLGISVFDAEGNMRDYHDIIQDMEAATIGLSDAQKDAAFNTVFGADAIRAATILSQEGVKGYEEMNAAVMEQGASASMAAAQNAGLAGTIEQITGSISSLATKLALPFLDDISAMGDQIASFVNQIGTLPQPVINAGLAFAGFAVAIALGTAAIGAILLVLPTLLSPIGLIAIALVLAGAAAAALWAAWELNFGNIQEKTAAVMAVIQPQLDAFVTDVTSVATAAAAAGTAISTMFTTAFADAKFPSFDELFADILAGDFGSLAGKLQAALDRLVLNLKVQLTPEPTAARPPSPMGRIKDPEFDPKAWADIPARMISSLTATIKGGNWEGIGNVVGGQIVDAWNREVDKIKVSIAIGAGLAGAISGAFNSMNAFYQQAVAALVQFGADLHATGLPAKIAELGAAITTAVSQMFTGMIEGIMNRVMKPVEDASSTADILRERALGSEVNWGDYIPKINWSTFVTSLTWGDFITAIAWANFVLSLSWSNFVTAITWSQFISNLGWNSFVPELSWSAWIPHLDWSRFVSWLTIPSGGGGGGGGIGGQPEHLNDPRPQAMGTSYWAGGTALVGEHGPELVRLPQGSQIYSNGETMAMAGGVTINVNVASITNSMDIEQLAAQLARRFQQKLRL